MILFMCFFTASPHSGRQAPTFFTPASHVLGTAPCTQIVSVIITLSWLSSSDPFCLVPSLCQLGSNNWAPRREPQDWVTLFFDVHCTPSLLPLGGAFVATFQWACPVVLLLSGPDWKYIILKCEWLIQTKYSLLSRDQTWLHFHSPSLQGKTWGWCRANGWCADSPSSN